MFEHTRAYPTSLTASSASEPESILLAIRWTLEAYQKTGGSILLFVPGKQNLEYQQPLLQLSRHRDVVTATWRTITNTLWRGGPVLAAWPSEQKLAEIADDRRTMALCVISWNDEDSDAWRRAASPTLLGSAAQVERDDRPLVTDPVVEQGLQTLTTTVNHANNLAGSLDRRDAIAVLRTLHDGGHRLVAEDIYAWALANGWPARGAERLKQLSSDIAAGKRPRMNGPFPFRPDILDIWRGKATNAS